MKKKILNGTLIGIGAVICFILGWLANSFVVYKAMNDVGDLIDELEEEIDDLDDEFDEFDEDDYIFEGEETEE